MLGDQIRTLRLQFKLTQSDLSEKLGVSKQSISCWENNTNIPSVDIVCQIARIFGCTTDYLLEMDDRTYLIETNHLTESQAAQIKNMVAEFEKINKQAGLF